MITITLVAIVFSQALPGGQYVMPSSPAMGSYAPQPKERFTVEVYGPGFRIDRDGNKVEDKETLLGTYSIQDSQWPGLKKNIEKFCRQKKLQVAKFEPGSSVHVYLIPTPPQKSKVQLNSDLDYEKGVSPAKKPAVAREQSPFGPPKR